MIDLLGALDPLATAASYLVNDDTTDNPNGSVGGGTLKVFPPYNKDALINSDDLTTVSDQIYFVKGMGGSAYIGKLHESGGLSWESDPAAVSVCDLGNQGWAQAYAGIASSSWSTPLVPSPEDPPISFRLATFYLKTDTGNLLTALVLGQPTGLPLAPTISPLTYQCFIFKDRYLQQAEYKRTNGFERTEITKPYYIY